ncbi:MAG: 50S ribosomal protein L34 [Candidatus Jorgensenbacteria bacterium]|nr:50S ribosomal protein L34 [Candidatus Jorgensenbacteria bacterium]
MSVTYQPNRRKRKRTHGFLVRSRSTTGRRILIRRRRKGRKRLAPR